MRVLFLIWLTYCITMLSLRLKIDSFTLLNRIEEMSYNNGPYIILYFHEKYTVQSERHN